MERSLHAPRLPPWIEPLFLQSFHWSPVRRRVFVWVFFLALRYWARGTALITEDQRSASPRMSRYAPAFVVGLFGYPRDVWKICARGLGIINSAAWLVRTTARSLSQTTEWRRCAWFVSWRLAVVILLVAWQWYESSHAPSGVVFAAFAATTVWEVQTGGNDTNNGGAFDPGQTAGMFTDGAATSANTAAPVFTSASYNFVAGDVNAWVYIASGTNWTAGWYQITSVAANAATLNATIGQAVLRVDIQPTTVVGCATVASPTVATWSIDYSQQAGSQFTYTDLSSTGVGLTVSSAAFPFAKQQVGNSFVVTSGTNFTAGRYVIASVSGTTATVLGAANLHTGAGTDSDGAGRQGGAVASLGLVGGVAVGANRIFIKTGTHSITTATANTSGGTFQPALSNVRLEGYSVTRHDRLSPPTLQASAISTFTLVLMNSSGDWHVENLILDGASAISSRGLGVNRGSIYLVQAKNCTNSGFAVVTNSGLLLRCSATGCETQPAFLIGQGMLCEAYTNTVTGFSYNQGAWMSAFCIADGNSGASSDGFAATSNLGSWINCTSYGNGRDGFRSTTVIATTLNCLAEANSALGFNLTGLGATLLTCGVFNNTSGAVGTLGTNSYNTGLVTATSTFFTNAAGRDFSLNNTATGGALARAAGIPGAFPAGLTTGYLDIGAAQHADPVAGGGAQMLQIGGAQRMGV